ncbi:MAG: inositol monophosphatase [Anaerolinea sp.]|nr:inositol monophosphatase [Anaerolinea sp.]
MTYTDTRPTLDEVEHIAREAGQLLMTRFGQKHNIHFKGEVDLVTEADYLSEKYILDYLLKHYPSHQVITEESGSNQAESDHAWIIDPLDGTVNFAHGIPIFCVSIAYVYQGVVQLGVIFDPARSECFSGELGKGAWLNGSPIQVSGSRELIKSLLVTGFPYEKDEMLQRNLAYYGHFSTYSRGVRRLGSAAIDICYVACGRFDGYWEVVVNPWDVAAGSLIAAEAGAQVSSVEGEPLILEMGGTILVANPGLHSVLLGVLHQNE